MASDLTSVPLVHAAAAGPRHKLVRASLLGSLLEGTHERPGQWVRVATSRNAPAEACVVASGPGCGAYLELLVPASGAIGPQLRAGQFLLVSRPYGAGLRLPEGEGAHLLLVGDEAGMAALRSLAHVVKRQRRRYGSVRVLLLASEAEGRTPCDDELATWEADDLEVVRVVPGADALTSALADEPAPPGGWWVFAAGQEQLVYGVRAALASIGVPLERLQTP